MAKVRLYDLRKKDYPNHREFRTLQVHQCPTCETRTNKAESTGGPGTYLSPICPNVLKDWHSALAELKHFLRQAQSDLAQSILSAEIDQLVRDHGNKIVDDIEGDADRSLTW